MRTSFVGCRARNLAVVLVPVLLGACEWEELTADVDTAQQSSETEDTLRQDRKAPRVTITSPSTGAVFSTPQTVTIRANARDDRGVTRVEFYEDGQLKGTVTAEPYIHSWAITADENGTRTWTAKAYDGVGNEKTSAPVACTVAISTCTSSLSASAASVSAAGGSGSLSIASTCEWAARSNADWLAVSPASGSGDAVVTFAASANPSATPRNGTLDVGGHLFTVSQAGAACAYALSIASASVPAAGGTGSVGVTASEGCPWTVTSGAAWLGVTSGAGGSGNGWVSYSVAANTALAARTGTLTVAGLSFAVSQEAAVDATPPTVPSGLSASASDCRTVNVSWNPSTDSGGSGLGGYIVYRNGVELVHVDGQTSATDSAAAASTTYAYSVRAIDQAGNLSAASSTASVTTPACPPPAVCGDNVCAPTESCSTCAADCCPTAVDCRNASTWPSTWAAWEDEVLRLVNVHRAQGATCGTTAYGAVGALAANAQLREASRCHSMDMAINNYFSHTSLDGTSPGTRSQRAGYTGSWSGENIAAGYASPSAVVTGWMASPGHCANIMSAGSNELGVGYGYGAQSTYRHYWTQSFGRR